MIYTSNNKNIKKNIYEMHIILSNLSFFQHFLEGVTAFHKSRPDIKNNAI